MNAAFRTGAMRAAQSAMRTAAGTVGRRALLAAARVTPYVGAGLTAYEAVQAVRNAFGSKNAATQRRMVKYTRGYRSRYSKKSGYRWKKAVVKRYRRKGKVLYRKRYVIPKQAKAIIENNRGGTVEDPNCVYLCNQTAPLGNIKYCAMAGLLKDLMNLHGEKYNMLDDFANCMQTNAATIFIEYRETLNGPGVQSLVYTGAASTTYTTIVSAMYNWNPTNIKEDGRIIAIQLNDDSGKKTEMKLENYQLTFLINLTCKFQNRSVNELNDQNVDTIDRCPCEVKTYYGKGNSTALNGAFNVIDFTPNNIDPTNSIAAAAGGGTEVSTLPPPSILRGCIKSKSGVIQPGEIKGERLYSKINVSLDWLLKKHERARTQGILGDLHHSLGHFKLVGFEKTIGNVTGNTQNCKVIWETKHTVHVFTRNSLQNIQQRRILNL